MNNKPSDFAKIEPMSSVTKEAHHETVAMNIMRVLAKTGDTFRKLTFEEYIAERIAPNHTKVDGNYTFVGHFFGVESEDVMFATVAPYCESAEKASEFAPAWNKLYLNSNK